MTCTQVFLVRSRAKTGGRHLLSKLPLTGVEIYRKSRVISERRLI